MIKIIYIYCKLQVDTDDLPSDVDAIKNGDDKINLKCNSDDKLNEDMSENIFNTSLLPGDTGDSPLSRAKMKNPRMRKGGKKKHTCNICLKSFTQSASLSGHMSIHTKEKKANSSHEPSPAPCNDRLNDTNNESLMEDEVSNDHESFNKSLSNGNKSIQDSRLENDEASDTEDKSNNSDPPENNAPFSKHSSRKIKTVNEDLPRVPNVPNNDHENNNDSVYDSGIENNDENLLDNDAKPNVSKKLFNGVFNEESLAEESSLNRESNCSSSLDNELASSITDSVISDNSNNAVANALSDAAKKDLKVKEENDDKSEVKGSNLKMEDSNSNDEAAVKSEIGDDDSDSDKKEAKSELDESVVPDHEDSYRYDGSKVLALVLSFLDLGYL